MEIPKICFDPSDPNDAERVWNRVISLLEPEGLATLSTLNEGTVKALLLATIAQTREIAAEKADKSQVNDSGGEGHILPEARDGDHDVVLASSGECPGASDCRPAISQEKALSWENAEKEAKESRARLLCAMYDAIGVQRQPDEGTTLLAKDMQHVTKITNVCKAVMGASTAAKTGLISLIEHLNTVREQRDNMWAQNQEIGRKAERLEVELSKVQDSAKVVVDACVAEIKALNHVVDQLWNEIDVLEKAFSIQDTAWAELAVACAVPDEG